MDDTIDFISEQRAKVIARICAEDGAVISMETCIKIARLWLHSDEYKRGIMIDILGQYNEQNHKQ